MRDDICNYERLEVWQKAMDLVDDVYLIIKRLPKEELYGLTGQLRRAVVSIPLNIAEGQIRGGKEFGRFLNIARGSAHEVNCILQICLRQKYIGEDEYLGFREKILRVSRMISGLIKSLD